MKKKKLIYLLVAMMAVLALVGCGDKKRLIKIQQTKILKKASMRE